MKPRAKVAKRIENGYLIPLNVTEDGLAATLKTSNHRAGNIICPEGGRAEMGILDIRICRKGNI